MTGTCPLQREIAAAARPHPCRAATPSWTSAPLDTTKNTNGIPRFRAWSAAWASRTPSAWVMAPRRIDPSARQMTTFRPPIRPTTDVTAPTMPLPTSTSDVVVIPAECRPFSSRWRPAPLLPPLVAAMAPPSNAELARLSDAELMEEAAATSRALASLAGRFVLVTAELDRREGWRAEGATSLESWIMERCGVSLPTARAYAAVGERLFDLPHLAAALCEGTLSFDKVRAVAESASPETRRRVGRGGQGVLGAPAGRARPLEPGALRGPGPRRRTTPGRCASTARCAPSAPSCPKSPMSPCAPASRPRPGPIPPMERPGGTSAWPTPSSRW